MASIPSPISQEAMRATSMLRKSPCIPFLSRSKHPSSVKRLSRLRTFFTICRSGASVRIKLAYEERKRLRSSAEKRVLSCIVMRDTGWDNE